MFGRKKNKTEIDKEQLELIQNAQDRIKQKKRLYYHFVIFLIGAIVLIVLNVAFGFGKTIKIFGTDWFVYAVLAWLLLFLIHVFNVFVTQRFMGKDWEQEQIEKLVLKQQEGIEKIKSELKVEAPTGTKTVLQNKTKVTDRNSELTIIVAAGENDAIGKENRLLWHLRDDLKRFKELTLGHHIIMGRKTFESFSKPLPKRTNIVISAQPNYQVPEGVIVVNSLDEALEVAKNDSQPFIIGGGQIYLQAINLADKIEMTRVHETFEADTFFPKIDDTIWKEVDRIYHEKDAEHSYAFWFITYKKIV